jgi:Ser/Thr protein kinase RdoA (MazF antagonist)
VHGDWTPLNVLIRRDGWAGILDFEACGHGPAVLDLANMCSTLLMWSRLDNVPERMATLVSSFAEKADVPVGLDIVHISMLTHWFGHYFDWHERALTDENTEVVRRLLGRIETVFHFATK